MRDLTGRDIECGVEVDDAVALVIVGMTSRASLTKRQRELGALESLNLRLLVQAPNNRVLGWIQIEPDHVAHLRGGLRIFTYFVCPRQVRPEAVRANYRGDRAARQIELASKESGRPARSAGGRRLHRGLHDPLDDLGRDGVILPPSLRLISKPINAVLNEAAANAPDLIDRDSHPQRNLRAAHPISTHEDNPGAPHMPGSRRRARNQRVELATLSGGERDR